MEPSFLWVEGKVCYFPGKYVAFRTQREREREGEKEWYDYYTV